MRNHPPPFHDDEIEALARRLEAAFQTINRRLLRLAGVEAEAIVEAFGDVHAQMLGFDTHGRTALREAIESARVKTLSQGNIFVACALSSAIALSEFKRQPRLTNNRFARPLDRLRRLSTNALSLSLFAMSSFYALLGTKTYQRLAQRLRERPLNLP